MLPGSRDRPDIGGLKELVREAELWSHDAVSELIAGITGYRKLSVAYAGAGYAEAAASTLYWILKVLAPGAPIELHSAEGELYHVLAYEKSEAEAPKTIIVFAEEGAEGVVAKVADAAKILRALLAVIAPPLHPLIAARIPEDAIVVEVPPGGNLHMLFLAARLGVELTGRIPGCIRSRLSRVKEEVKDFTSIVEELAARYEEDVERLARLAGSGGPLLLSYTPTMRAAAAVLESLLDEAGVPSKRASVSSLLSMLSSALKVKHYKAVVLLSTDVEDDVVREVKYRASMKIPRSSLELYELRIRTDPLTAPMYACILIEALRCKLRSS